MDGGMDGVTWYSVLLRREMGSYGLAQPNFVSLIFHFRLPNGYIFIK